MAKVMNHEFFREKQSTQKNELNLFGNMQKMELISGGEKNERWLKELEN